MKKNGFTLVELLAVVSIISLLLLLVAPKIVNQLNNSKEEVNDVTKKIIYSAAEKYIKDNNMNLEYDYCLSVEELQDKEYLSDTITDNKSGLDISKKSVRITPKDNFGYEYELTSKCNNLVTNEDHRGYYADVDGNGTIDGVIYADLAFSKSGEWRDDGIYSYELKTNLNEYIISKTKYKGKFGEKEIIKLNKNNGNERFYVMALENFTEGSFKAGNGQCYQGSDCDFGTYYWYYEEAFGYANEKVTSLDFGTGRENTRIMLEKWNAEEYGLQNDYDIFKHIQAKYNEGWYIPSLGEWGAFADYMSNREQDKIIFGQSGNYRTIYGLFNNYWTSSQSFDEFMWCVDFEFNNTVNIEKSSNINVRLSAIF